jgi:prepilin-type N-terminal cleavage/methylation domain-containing protein
MATSATRRRARHQRGITLVEMLIALFVLSLVVTFASIGIVQALRVQSLNEANASLQGKLRRITEVISQDLRSTVLGSVIATPYASGASSVSFTLAEGGQGYQALGQTNNTTNFATQTSLRVVAEAPNAAALGMVGRTVLIVNGAGDGSLFPVTAASSQGGSGNNRWFLEHAPCPNAIPFVAPMRLFVVDAVGYERNAAGDLQRRVAGQDAQDLAFDLSAFEIEYVYRDATGALEVRSAPYLDAGVPLRIGGPSGDAVLDSLRVRIAAQQPIVGAVTIERSYTAQIAMPVGGSVNLRSVVTCP